MSEIENKINARRVQRRNDKANIQKDIIKELIHNSLY
jgi:hypothetical protein